MKYWINLLHIYQPPYQDSGVIDNVVQDSYGPLIAILKKNPHAKITLNISGSLVEQLFATHNEGIIEGIQELVEKKQIELTATASYHPILPLIPENEMLRQIHVNNNILTKAFGKLYKPKGFFLPEMAYSHKVATMLDQLHYEWVMLDEIHFNGKFHSVNFDKKYFIKNTKLTVIFRSRKISKTFVPKTLSDSLEDENDLLPQHIITATDGEMYGHFHKNGEDIFASVLSNPKITTRTASEYVKMLPHRSEIISPISASWETSPEDIKNHIPYILWNDPKNTMQKLLWELARLSIHIVNRNSHSKNYEWARRHLDRGLASCTWWWASEKKPDVFSPIAWNPDIIEKGAKELVSSIRSLETLRPDTKIQAETIHQKLTKEIWKKHWHSIAQNKKDIYAPASPIEKKEVDILRNFSLQPKYKLSTTGHYHVTNCFNKDGDEFILKIPLKNTITTKTTFLKEIAFWKNISAFTDFPLRSPEIMYTATKRGQEYFLYKKIEGKNIGELYYIYNIHQVLTYIDTVIRGLSYIQSKTDFLKENIPHLKNFYFKENYEFFCAYTKYATKYLNAVLITKAQNILKKKRSLFNNQNLKICHGDLNPRNILYSSRGVSIIDWSGVCLNNPMFDFAFFSLFLIREPKVENTLVKILKKNYSQDDYVFYRLNQLLILPKFIKILDDSLAFASTDEQRHIIRKGFLQSKKRLEETIKQLH